MRMAGPDIVLFVVGAVLFGGASFAIVQEDGGLTGQTSALGIFQVSYEVGTVEVDTVQVASMRAGTAAFEIDEANVLRVLLHVECTDPLPVAFSFQVEVEGPNGETGQGAGSCTVPVDIAFALGELPGDTTVAGTTEAEARENLAVDNFTAKGAWTVTISGSRGQQPVPIPVADPAGTATLSVEVAQPRFTAVTR